MERSKRPTERQQAIYDFIAECARTSGLAPTIREIGKQFGLSSPNGVIGHLRALEKKGFIKRIGKSARAIAVTAFADMVHVDRADLEAVRAMVGSANGCRSDMALLEALRVLDGMLGQTPVKEGGAE